MACLPFLAAIGPVRIASYMQSLSCKTVLDPARYCPKGKEFTCMRLELSKIEDIRATFTGTGLLSGLVRRTATKGRFPYPAI
jgi:hypothetical protein